MRGLYSVDEGLCDACYKGLAGETSSSSFDLLRPLLFPLSIGEELFDVASNW